MSHTVLCQRIRNQKFLPPHHTSNPSKFQPFEIPSTDRPYISERENSSCTHIIFACHSTHAIRVQGVLHTYTSPWKIDGWHRDRITNRCRRNDHLSQDPRVPIGPKKIDRELAGHRLWYYLLFVESIARGSRFIYWLMASGRGRCICSPRRSCMLRMFYWHAGTRLWHALRPCKIKFVAAE